MLHETSTSVDDGDPANALLISVVSGAIAGVICDVTFFPLDTLKTRLQSQHGFIKSGGFKQLYKGVGPVMVGSPPAASLFFLTYEGTKMLAQPYIPLQYHSFVHAIAASFAEAAACLIRVPVEVSKQRKQALLSDTKRLALRTLYRGYTSTVIRDVPFGLIQMPLWEYFKLYWKRQVHRECTPIESACCGGMSVAISAAITTPLDVAKTRIMLSATSAGKEEVKIFTMLQEVYRLYAFKGLFAGVVPRVIGFTIGGFIFFGVYDKLREMCATVFRPLPKQS